MKALKRPRGRPKVEPGPVGALTIALQKVSKGSNVPQETAHLTDRDELCWILFVKHLRAGLARAEAYEAAADEVSRPPHRAPMSARNLRRAVERHLRQERDAGFDLSAEYRVRRKRMTVDQAVEALALLTGLDPNPLRARLLELGFAEARTSTVRRGYQRRG